MAFVSTDLKWIQPLQAAASIANQNPDIVFLHSSMKTGYSGRYSFLAWDIEEQFTGTDIRSLLLPADDALLFGYISYEAAQALEVLPATQPSFIPLPTYFLARFLNVLRFDQEKQVIETWNGAPVRPFPTITSVTLPPRIASLGSNMDKDGYLAILADTLSHISEGDFYQANVTRKFFGTFSDAPDEFALYQRLVEASPAPYSAFLRLNGISLLSSSPELFFKIEDGRIVTRPIKGTAPKEQDEAALANSKKDQAENLMIVDLMRHDLSQVCTPGSVEVKELFSTDSFSTLHHLSSVIEGRLQPGITYLDALVAAFPPGSMTGAPKIAAMKFLAEKETLNRGAYSGALGWMTKDAAEWSVVIRTLILKGKKFEFQVGGGIVADSVPEKEWEETLIKARGVAAALGIDMALLSGL